jgi:hypothetical protein
MTALLSFPRLGWRQQGTSIGYSASAWSFAVWTLTAPIQSLQQARSSPIRSRGFSFQFFSTTSNNQPSGISPSKNGNNTLFEYLSANNRDTPDCINCFLIIVCFGNPWWTVFRFLTFVNKAYLSRIVSCSVESSGNSTTFLFCERR